ncbi:hypothetical protein QR680_009616 [Steinernema hermaphroditum]|uniref:Transcription factor TFIIIC triple barrel domain-containing protein n=1 Tax=Steinernema hermaphroditum TaxID=289476 RepID=A0AA39MA30_9BILA|nr:hypothetical protein QR680_009616 [Steinernema hermaphroditum]
MASTSNDVEMVGTDESDDESYEEVTMIMQLDGVLDTSIVRENVRTGQCTVRRTGTAQPVVQIGKSLYSAEWVQTMGTDLILKTNEQQQLELVSVSGARMNAEKALASASSKDKAPSTQKEGAKTSKSTKGTKMEQEKAHTDVS